MSDIDFVVLWVDGADPEWAAEKNKYMGITINDSNSDNRFRDWGLMKYWFRAVEQYTPWVRKIHFVTWGHIPSFLNTEHPKLNIVRHDQFIPEQYLPLFNSAAIEMNVHRIDGLSEKFVLFNDDTILLKPLKERDFFLNGLPCGYYAELPASFVGVPKEWEHTIINNLGIINKHFSKKKTVRKNRKRIYSFQYSLKDNIRTWLLGNINPDSYVGFKNFHCPVPFEKSTFESIWNLEYEILSDTSSHKFRDNRDVNPWLALWWQLAKGDFVPRRNSTRTFAVTSECIEEIVNCVIGQKYEMICLNDPSEEIDFDFLSDRLQKAFLTLLPNASEFEKN